MKKIYLLAIFMMASLVANAQFVNGGGSSRSGSSSGSSSGLYSSGNGARFQGSFGSSLSFFAYGAGPSFDLELGSRIRDYIYVGGGTGLHTVFSRVDGLLCLPIYANAKAFLPVTESIMPFVNYSIGASIFWLPFDTYTRRNTYINLYTNVGLGVELGRHQISAGYEYMGLHSGYFKYAITF